MAIALAFFVTILWSFSWVLIKIGLQEINPLLFAGFRYFIASISLVVISLKKPEIVTQIGNLTKKEIGILFLYGIFYYTLTQGTQFLGLYYLPAITVSFMLNLTTLLVLILAIPLIQEYPSKIQIGLVLLALIGVLLFFFPINLPAEQLLGIGIMAIGVLSNALSSIIGRSLNRREHLSPLTITSVSMTIGSTMLLVIAILMEGIPDLSLRIILIIIWLAIVHTALAFFLWNWSLQDLTAVESSLINSTMLPQITVLAIIFFSESLVFKQWVGLILIFVTGIAISLTRQQNQVASEMATESTILHAE